MPAPHRKPVHPKVKAAGIGGGIGAVVIGLLAGLGVDIPESAAALIDAIVAFVFGYIKTS